MSVTEADFGRESQGPSSRSETSSTPQAAREEAHDVTDLSSRGNGRRNHHSDAARSANDNRARPAPLAGRAARSASRNAPSEVRSSDTRAIGYAGHAIARRDSRHGSFRRSSNTTVASRSSTTHSHEREPPDDASDDATSHGTSASSFSLAHSTRYSMAREAERNHWGPAPRRSSSRELRASPSSTTGSGSRLATHERVDLTSDLRASHGSNSSLSPTASRSRYYPEDEIGSRRMRDIAASPRPHASMSAHFTAHGPFPSMHVDTALPFPPSPYMRSAGTPSPGASRVSDRSTNLPLSTRSRTGSAQRVGEVFAIARRATPPNASPAVSSSRPIERGKRMTSPAARVDSGAFCTSPSMLGRDAGVALHDSRYGHRHEDSDSEETNQHFSRRGDPSPEGVADPMDTSGAGAGHVVVTLRDTRAAATSPAVDDPSGPEQRASKERPPTAHADDVPSRGDDFAFVRKTLPKAAFSHEEARAEFRCLDYCPLVNIRPVDLTEQLRALKAQRKIRLFICITCYNEEGDELHRTLSGIASNLPRLAKQSVHWSEVAVCIIVDGRDAANPRMLDYLHHELKLFDPGVLQTTHRGHPVVMHMFERSVELPRHATQREYHYPLQCTLALKERNGGKLNSHLWFFSGFCVQLNPKFITLLDVGTVPHRRGLCEMYTAMENDPQLGGVCGEIRVRDARPWNILDAAQSFEYRVNHALDKACESMFGYISVLPGAFSAYRWVAIRGEPLAAYFTIEETAVRDLGPFMANMYLAEDRILCFEILARRHRQWLLGYVPGAKADTDVPATLVELIKQRRRWLNGSLFALVYYLYHFPRFFKTSHGLARKTMLSMQFMFYAISAALAWFTVGTLFLSFLVIFYQAIEYATFGQAELRVAFGFGYCTLLLLQVVLGLVGRVNQMASLYLGIAVVYATMMVFSIILGVWLVLTSTMTWLVGLAFACCIFSYLVAAAIHGVLLKSAVMFFQYFMLLPLFVNVFPIYSMCNLHDISWGTKEGNLQAEQRRSHEVAADLAIHKAERAQALANALLARRGRKQDATSALSPASAMLRTRELPSSAEYMKVIDEERDMAGYVDVSHFRKTDAMLNMHIDDVASIQRNLGIVMTDELVEQLVRDARRAAQRHQEAADRERRLAEQMVADRANMQMNFNNFRVRMLMTWLIGNALLVVLVMEYDPDLAGYAFFAACSVIYAIGFKLLGSMLFQTRIPWALRESYAAVVRTVRHSVTLAICVKSAGRTLGSAAEYYILDDMWEAEHGFAHSYPIEAREALDEEAAMAEDDVPEIAGYAADGTALYWLPDGSGVVDLAGRVFDNIGHSTIGGDISAACKSEGEAGGHMQEIEDGHTSQRRGPTDASGVNTSTAAHPQLPFISDEPVPQQALRIDRERERRLSMLAVTRAAAVMRGPKSDRAREEANEGDALGQSSEAVADASGTHQHHTAVHVLAASAPSVSAVTAVELPAAQHDEHAVARPAVGKPQTFPLVADDKDTRNDIEVSVTPLSIRAPRNVANAGTTPRLQDEQVMGASQPRVAVSPRTDTQRASMETAPTGIAMASAAAGIPPHARGAGGRGWLHTIADLPKVFGLARSSSESTGAAVASPGSEGKELRITTPGTTAMSKVTMSVQSRSPAAVAVPVESFPVVRRVGGDQLLSSATTSPTRVNGDQFGFHDAGTGRWVPPLCLSASKNPVHAQARVGASPRTTTTSMVTGTPFSSPRVANATSGTSPAVDLSDILLDAEASLQHLFARTDDIRPTSTPADVTGHGAGAAAEAPRPAPTSAAK